MVKSVADLYSTFSNAFPAADDLDEALSELARLVSKMQSREATDETWRDEANASLRAIAASPLWFPAAIAMWITRDDSHSLASALVHEASVLHLNASQSQAFDLTSLEESRAVLAGYRLCASYSAPAVSLGWALSLARDFPGSDSVSCAVDEMIQHHIEELPDTTRRLLAAQDSPFATLAQAVDAMERISTQDLELASLARLPEFEMTPDMRGQFSSLKRRERRDIDRKTSQMSILSQIFTQQHFKYSTQAAVEFHVGDAIRETTMAMTAHSLSVELPLSEVTDPMIGAMRRRLLWRGPTT